MPRYDLIYLTVCTGSMSRRKKPRVSTIKVIFITHVFYAHLQNMQCLREMLIPIVDQNQLAKPDLLRSNNNLLAKIKNELILCKPPTFSCLHLGLPVLFFNGTR